MIKIGVLLKDLMLSQCNYEFITQANKFYSPKHTGEADIIAFYESLSIHCTQLFFACMNIKEAWSYNGMVVATSLNTAKRLITFPTPKNKLFYIYDLEWMLPTHREFSKFAEVYTNNELVLLARSDKHAKLIEEAWGTKVYDVIENFNLRGIINVVERMASRTI